MHTRTVVGDAITLLPKAILYMCFPLVMHFRGGRKGVHITSYVVCDCACIPML